MGRKVQEEAGLPAERLQLRRVLGVANTFFDKSVHMSEDSDSFGPATQTINVVVHMELRSEGGGDGELVSDEHHTGIGWAHTASGPPFLDPEGAQPLDQYV